MTTFDRFSPKQLLAMTWWNKRELGALAMLCEHLHLGIVWTSILVPLVLGWYILTELGSILENAVKMGAPVPEWLVKLLKTGLKAVDSKADTLQKEE